MLTWQIFIVLRQPVALSVTIFSNPTKLTNNLLSLLSNYMIQLVCGHVHANFTSTSTSLIEIDQEIGFILYTFGSSQIRITHHSQVTLGQILRYFKFLKFTKQIKTPEKVFHRNQCKFTLSLLIIVIIFIFLVSALLRDCSLCCADAVHDSYT